MMIWQINLFWNEKSLYICRTKPEKLNEALSEALLKKIVSIRLDGNILPLPVMSVYNCVRICRLILPFQIYISFL